MTLISSSLKTYSANNPPAWSSQPNFGFKLDQSMVSKLPKSAYLQNPNHICSDDYYVSVDYELEYEPGNDELPPTPPRPPVNPNPPTPQPPSPRPEPPIVPPVTPPVDPPVPPVNPEPRPNPNQINISGTRQVNGQSNFFDFKDNPGSRKNLTIAPNSGAIFNNLNSGVDASLGANFAGYIGGFTNNATPGVVIRGQGGGVNAIAHAFTRFQDPIDNTAGSAPIDIDLSSGGAPDRMIVLGGEGRINGVENLTLMSSRTGANGNRGFDINGAENVRIVAVNIQELARQGQVRVFRDERGSIYRISDAANNVNVSATGNRDRTSADSTYEDVAGQAPIHGIRQNGALPHDTVVVASDGQRVAVDNISPSNTAIAAATQNNQPTRNAGLGTATLA
jgi:hypothetical protein